DEAHGDAGEGGPERRGTAPGRTDPSGSPTCCAVPHGRKVGRSVARRVDLPSLECELAQRRTHVDPHHAFWRAPARFRGGRYHPPAAAVTRVAGSTRCLPVGRKHGRLRDHLPRGGLMPRAHATLPVLALAAALFATAASAANDEQIIKYYRKKSNLPPAATVKIASTKDSTAIKGAKEGVIQVGDGPGAKNISFLSSADGKWVVFGTLEDVTVDPGKAVMAKINLKGQPFKGPENAKVTIVEYSDFQCPFCKRGYDTVETQILKEYDGKVKFYFKNYPLPFHPWAKPAAIAAECAKEQKGAAFWQIYKSFFENQAAVNPQNVKEKSTEFLKDSGIDMAK